MAKLLGPERFEGIQNLLDELTTQANKLSILQEKMQSVNKLVENYASPSDTGTGAKTFDEIRTDDTEIEKLFKNAEQDRVEVENLANSIQETKVAYEELLFLSYL